MKRIKFIVSPNAGDGRGQKAIGRITRWCDRSGAAEYSIDVAGRYGDTPVLARQARDAGWSAVVAVGGDGTVNEVAGVLAGSDVPMGIIPAGYGNDFVRSLALPGAVEDACAVIYAGHTRRIDTGRINGRVFVNTAGVGLDGLFVHLAAGKRGQVSSFTRYLETVLRFIPFYRGVRARIEIDGRVIEQDLIMLVTGNGNYQANGFPFLPLARLDDGLFDVCLVEPMSFPQKLWHTWLIRRGRHAGSSRVRFLTARRIRVSSAQELFGHADGEAVAARDYEIEMVPRSLSVIVPGGKDETAP